MTALARLVYVGTGLAPSSFLSYRPRSVGTQILRRVYPERSEGLRMTRLERMCSGWHDRSEGM